MKRFGVITDKKGALRRNGLVLACVFFIFTLTHCGGGETISPIVQAPLPYAHSALQPFISAETIGCHYDGHHAAYVASANKLLHNTPFEGKSSEEILTLTSGDVNHAAIFNNVAQAWNHEFFWKSLKPGGGGIPTGLLAEKIDASFGSFDAFKKQFLAAAKHRFGSGWVWLVLDGDTLKIEITANADTPIAHGRQPIFVVDVWEHAYYLDYRNKRIEFVEAVLNHLANWEFAADLLEKHPLSQ